MSYFFVRHILQEGKNKVISAYPYHGITGSSGLELKIT